MERKVIVICIVVGLLGLVSAAAGFTAEFNRIRGYQVRYTSPSLCVYPRSPALLLGLIAALALVIAQIIINVATGFICCKRGPHKSNSKWKMALACIIISWSTFGTAFLLLVVAAGLNDEHGVDHMYLANNYCYVVKPGVFAGASVLSLLSVVFGLVYYITLTSEKNILDPSWVEPAALGIAMGQPQVPPHNPDPVFVHEDTYTRRQFV